MRLMKSLLDRTTNLGQTASRAVAILWGLTGALAGGSSQAADAAYDQALFSDIIDGVESSIFDVGAESARIALTLEGEHLLFKRESQQQVADGVIAWSGRSIHGTDATSLYVAKTGDDASIKLVKGDVEYDITKDRRGDSNPGIQRLGERAGTAKLANAQRMCNEFFKLGRSCWRTPQ